MLADAGLPWFRLSVNRSDTVTIHFFITEDEPETHTFTMTAPYAVDEVLNMGEDVDITFTANTAGVFPYRGPSTSPR